METDNTGHFFTVTQPNSNPARQDLTSVIRLDLTRPNLVPREIARGPGTRKTIGCREGPLGF